MTTNTLLQLRTDRIVIDIDISRGAEITRLVERRTGVDVLMRTPWADEALRRRPVPLIEDPYDSEREWTASYAGGWQTLVPHAGDAEEIDGVVRQYHGEGSIVPWTLDHVGEDRASAHVQLSSVPLHVTRTITLDGVTVEVSDVLTNAASRTVSYDYQSHPAFGAPFLDAGCRIELAAAAYVSDPRLSLGEVPAGARVHWPHAGPEGLLDLSTVPDSGSGVFRFGWLEDVQDRTVTITNPSLGLAATLEWNEPLRDRAWLWLDAGARTDAPWDGRSYALAIEPSTRATVRDRPSPQLAPGASHTFTTRLIIRTTNP